MIEAVTSNHSLWLVPAFSVAQNGGRNSQHAVEQVTTYADSGC